jgi:hypothetical protein
MQLLCVLSLFVALIPDPSGDGKPPAACAGCAAKGVRRSAHRWRRHEIQPDEHRREAGRTLHIVLKSNGTIPKIAWPTISCC